MNEPLRAAEAAHLLEDARGTLRLKFGLACAERVSHLLDDSRTVLKYFRGCGLNGRWGRGRSLTPGPANRRTELTEDPGAVDRGGYQTGETEQGLEQQH